MNEITNVSNSVNNDNTRGLHNWKNLFKKPTFNDWFTLFIIIMIVFMAWAYQHDTQVCRDSVAIIQDNMARAVPAVWALSQTSPNPFKASAKIRYSVPVTKSGEIRGYAVFIAVYDMLGRRVRTLVNETKYPGSYAITWNGADDHNKRLLQGMYIVRLSASGFAGSVKTYVLD